MAYANDDDRRTYQREWRRQQRLKNLEGVRASFKKWRLANLQYCTDRHREWVKSNPTKQLLLKVKQSARRRGLAFELTLEDMKIPDVCPVLGIPLRFGGMENRAGSPSVDRFDNTKGYVRGNIRIISWRANNLKRDATVEEIEKLLVYMKSRQ